MLELIKPSAAYEKDFFEMVNEYHEKSEFYGYHDIALRGFQEYLTEIENSEKGINLKPNIVPQTTFWLVKDEEIIVGESRLRHRLTPDLELEGGHIGYAIRPSQRLQGNGTKILKLTLLEVKKIGLDKALVTCNKDNIGSAKIIQANGGVLDSEGISNYSQKMVQRYWVPVV
jgi:predicted acetyltransferase